MEFEHQVNNAIMETNLDVDLIVFQILDILALEVLASHLLALQLVVMVYELQHSNVIMEISQAVDLIVFLIQDILAMKIKDYFLLAQQFVEIRSDLPMSSVTMETNQVVVLTASLIQVIHVLVVLDNHLLVQYLGGVNKVVEVVVEVMWRAVPALVIDLDNLLLDHQAQQHAEHRLKKVAQVQEALALIEEIPQQEAQQVPLARLQLAKI